MSLDVSIKFKSTKRENYFLSHPYIYSDLSERDLENYSDEDSWSANITHNLGEMARHVPVHLWEGKETTLYMVLWRPEELHPTPDTTWILPLLIEGLAYMIIHRHDLLPYNPSNGWGTYEGFMKFLLNYKQACEDNLGCEIEANR